MEKTIGQSTRKEQTSNRHRHTRNPLAVAATHQHGTDRGFLEAPVSQVGWLRLGCYLTLRLLLLLIDSENDAKSNVAYAILCNDYLCICRHGPA